MRTTILAIALLLTACTSRPVDLDDEVGATTAMDESTSESEDASTTGESTSSGDDSSMTFIHQYDVMSIHECDMFMQDCPPAEKCVSWASDGGNIWNANKCVPIMGDQQPGEPCWWGGIVEATDDCDATSMCWDVEDVDGEPIGVCMAYCQGTADAPECPPKSSCIITNNGTPALCIPDCDPVLQDCGEGLGCYWANTAFSCIFTAGGIPTGEPCGYINDCAPGNLCTNSDTLPACVGEACCTTFCDLQLGDAGCANQPGTACVGFPEPPERDFEYVGVCVLPP